MSNITGNQLLKICEKLIVTLINGCVVSLTGPQLEFSSIFCIGLQMWCQYFFFFLFILSQSSLIYFTGIMVERWARRMQLVYDLHQLTSTENRLVTMRIHKFHQWLITADFWTQCCMDIFGSLSHLYFILHFGCPGNCNSQKTSDEAVQKNHHTIVSI